MAFFVLAATATRAGIVPLNFLACRCAGTERGFVLPAFSCEIVVSALFFPGERFEDGRVCDSFGNYDFVIRVNSRSVWIVSSNLPSWSDVELAFQDSETRGKNSRTGWSHSARQEHVLLHLFVARKKCV